MSSTNLFRDRRRAMTLVELLVVVAIIGVLSSLLLPAVQQAREAARKLGCQSNLRQVGLALHNYHQALKSFPPGCMDHRPWRGSPLRKHFAWSALLLPYLEQGNLSQTIDFNYPFDNSRNAEASKAEIKLYQCPTAITNSGRIGRSDYGGLYGQRITTRNNTDNGVFIFNTPIRLRDIHDGITNTVAIAEDTHSPNSKWIDGSNVFEQSGAINDPKAWIGDNEIRSDHVGGAMTLFACSRVVFLSNETDSRTLGAIITRAGGEIFSLDE